ncbi:A24 family peptidase [Collimonas fungivorans]|uniref:Putative membrane protein n=1 Tax=Collimonas fungivorans (strain Ter331) TaxID=1005048 RepID=G0AIA3_COLFT|nr:A24 family peptidase [Collimonas fungivorans]AEK60686.1 putative membrane protein [Collimonas fungivorans Ter331]
MPDTSLILPQLFLLFCVAIFLYDYLFRRVPNKFLLIAMVVQLGCLLWLGKGLNEIGWLNALSGFAVGLAFFLPLYALRAMAAGDVKFFAVLGFLLGPGALLPAFLIASLIAAVHAIVMYVSRLGMVPGLQLISMRIMRWPLCQRVLEKRGKRVGIPYAAYLALAGAWIGMHGAGIVPGFT